jgi:hypothetical protein
MDPNANITEQRSIAAAMIALADKEEFGGEEGMTEFTRLGERLAELVQALAEWRQSGGFSPAEPLSISDAATLGSIIDACQSNHPTTWLARYPEGDLIPGGKTNTGVMRAICGDDQGRGFINADKDVRDGFVWISSTFEWFIPVRDVIRWVKAGEMALNYRG